MQKNSRLSGSQRAFVYILAASTAIAPGGLPAQAKPTEPPRRVPDFSKGRIEIPLKGILKEQIVPPIATPPAPTGSTQLAKRAFPDMSKMGIERPLKSLVREVPAPPVALKELEDKTSADANKVKPGLVTWHKNFASAKVASAKSGKPVLMFHMMGQLDDRFC